MPNRIIKETICDSLALSECSVFAQDLYKRLITYADDYGRFNSDTEIMRARLYAREYSSVDEQDIIDALIELAGVSKIQFYTAQVFNQSGKTGIYGAFPNWDSHQRQRETKEKTPKPDDTEINDWYLRRFIPLDMKAEILERDGFKCQICGKFLTPCKDSKRFAKLGSGLFHIDHIVPVVQGGRATLENLRLSCPECNLKRKKKFSFRDLLKESRGKLPQAAAVCGNLPLESESESESESNTNPEAENAPARVGTTAAAAALGIEAYAAANLDHLSPRNMEDLAGFMEHLTDELVRHAIDEACANGKRTWAYVRSILLRYSRAGYKTIGEVLAAESERERQKQSYVGGKPNPALNYEQRSHQENDYSGLFVDLEAEYGGDKP